MKISYPRQHHKRRALVVLGSLGIILLFAILAVLSLGGIHLARMGYAAMTSLRSHVETGVSSLAAVTTPHTKLLEENQALQDNITSLSGLRLERDALLVENAELRSLNTLPGSKARIIDYRTYPYGTLTARLEDTSSVYTGDVVMSGGLAIGEVLDVEDTLVTIELFTASNKELSVYVGSAGAATFIGRSTYGEVHIPRMIPVYEGDAVTLPRAQGKVIGVVSNVESKEGDTLQTLLVEVPVRLELLRFVTIVHE